jgi:hypothetical protein
MPVESLRIVGERCISVRADAPDDRRDIARHILVRFAARIH